MEERERAVVIDGVPERYLLRRKRVKRPTLRVAPDQSLCVTAPLTLPIREIERFLASSGDFIRRARKKNEAAGRNRPPRLFAEGETLSLLGKEKRISLREGKRAGIADAGDVLLFTLPDPGDAEARKKLFAAWEKKEALAALTAVSRGIYPLFAPYGVSFPEIRTRRMTSRWGSCQPKKGIVTLNSRLLEAPLPCAEYVAIHEFAHFLVPDHSPAFHRHMDFFCPDWRERKKLLEKSVRIDP